MKNKHMVFSNDRDRRTNKRGSVSRSNRTGFTLLEVLLTLGLAVVLMALVGAVFQFYTREMDTSDMDIRQTVLASAVIQMIEDDLRATIFGEPADMEGLAALMASTGGGAAQQAGGGGGDAGDAATTSEIDLDMDAADEEVVDLTSGVAILQEPGLIGNQFQIQVDVSRLPRLEEYTVLLSEDTNTTIQDVPSDVKTVSYYVQPAGGGIEDDLGATANAEATTGGLVRRILDRAATTFAAEQGNLTLLNQTGEIIAPEVVSIEFSYWDGLTWLLEWSSDDYGELPMAIKVQVTMADVTATADPDGETPLRTFAHIIRLPMGKYIEEEEEETEDEDLSAAGL